MLKPGIVEKPELKIIGLESPFIHALSPQSNNFKVIPPLWEQFAPLADEVPNRTGSQMYGIIYGRPEAQRKHPEELQYIGAVSVNSSDNGPPGRIFRTSPAGTFAVFLHRGPIHKIADTCREIYRVRLPQSAYVHSEIADVEVYDDRFNPESDESEMEYWISVKRK